MDASSHAHALQWEMYGPGTEVAFCAQVDADGYHVVVERDRSPILSGQAADGPTLLRISAELRAQLQQLGFGAKPLAQRASVLVGGVCWGPAAPLQSCLIGSMR